MLSLPSIWAALQIPQNSCVAGQKIWRMGRCLLLTMWPSIPSFTNRRGSEGDKIATVSSHPQCLFFAAVRISSIIRIIHNFQVSAWFRLVITKFHCYMYFSANIICVFKCFLVSRIRVSYCSQSLSSWWQKMKCYD